MPTYEYACRECGHNFDVVQSFSDDPLTVCPSCGGALRKVFSPAGIIFKGSGYYATDSRAAATPKADAPASTAGGDTPSGDASGGSTESGSDGKSTTTKKDTAGAAGGSSSTSES